MRGKKHLNNQSTVHSLQQPSMESGVYESIIVDLQARIEKSEILQILTMKELEETRKELDRTRNLLTGAREELTNIQEELANKQAECAEAAEHRANVDELIAHIGAHIMAHDDEIGADSDDEYDFDDEDDFDDENESESDLENESDSGWETLSEDSEIEDQ